LLLKAELCDQLCREVEMTRKKRGHANLDKRELLQIISWVRVVKREKEEMSKTVDELKSLMSMSQPKNPEE
jgi:hypothetical protein